MRIHALPRTCFRVLGPPRSLAPRPRVQTRAQNSSKTSDSLNEFTQAAQTKFASFWKDASPKLAVAVEELKSSAQRAYAQLDSEYEITDRAARAAKRAQEKAQDVDQEYGVRRKLRTWADNLQRAWPVWSRRFQEFSATPVGKVTVIVAAVSILATPIFWRLLNWLIFLWWLALPLATFALQRLQQQQAQKAAQQAAEEEERRRNPFASMFRGATERAGGTGGSKAGSKVQSTGPVIEAEWRPLDDKK